MDRAAALNAIVALLDGFRQCFTQPGFYYFREFVLTAWLGEGRRTVTAVWQAAAGPRHFSCFHRFLATYRWSAAGVARRLFDLVLAQLGAERDASGQQWLTVAIDDTLTRKYGRCLEGAGWQHDAMAPNPKAPLAWGQCFVMLGVLHQRGERWRCFPVAAWLFRPEKSAGAPPQHETKLTLLGRRLRAWKLPAHLRLRVVGDTAYGKRVVADALWELNHCLISRLPRNSLVFEKPLARDPAVKRRGAPKKYGEKRTLAHFAALALQSSPTAVTLYGQSWQVHLHSQRVLSRALGGVELLLVTVLRVGPQGRLGRPTFLFSTDLTLTAVQVVGLYAARFTIELAFRELKNQFGLGHCQARTLGAVERSVQLCLVAYTSSQLYAASAAPAGRETPWRAAPEIATTGQLRHAAQRERAAQITVGICRKHGISQEKQQAIYTDLLRAA